MKRMKTQMTETDNASIRVLIVDDHVILRQGICVMLNKDGNFDVVGEAEDEREALLLAAELLPDIVLIDICLGTANGLDIAKQLLRCCPGTHIVLYGGFHCDKLFFDALRNRRPWFLRKTISIDALPKSLRAVQNGEGGPG